jgi:hypothetical protein
MLLFVTSADRTWRGKLPKLYPIPGESAPSVKERLLTLHPVGERSAVATAVVAHYAQV